jgi:glycosyltransferase involved in cell wall biosynthesis
MKNIRHILFLYWGRRGLSQLTRELAVAAASRDDMRAVLSLSRQNEEFEQFKSDTRLVLEPIDTFAHGSGAVLQAWRIPLIAMGLRKAILRHRIDTVVTLMPHVWSPLIMPLLGGLPIRHYAIIHDAVPHPGDRTGLSHQLLLQTGRQADKIITLSQSVTDKLKTRKTIGMKPMITLFHPLLRFGSTQKARIYQAGEPWRLLFLGRIQTYKGLSLLLDSIEIIRQSGQRVELTIMGEGSLAAEQDRLQRLNVSVLNRWLSEDDIAQALASHHAIVLSHIEASQSGIAAMALGNEIPVIATPVGGLVEQITDGHTGLLARAVTASALAQRITDLFSEPALYDAVRQGLAQHRARHSCDNFIAQMLAAIADDD